MFLYTHKHRRYENQILKQELSLELRQSKMTNSTTATLQIKKLQDRGDCYTRKIELEKRRVAELEQQIKLVRAKVMEQRHKMGGVNASRENNQIIAKQIRILENRLDKALVKYNETLGNNKMLRQKIDTLRRERVVFDGIYKKLERELHDKKKMREALRAQAEVACQQRDDALGEMETLRSQAEEEQDKFEREWKNLSRLIEEDKLRKATNLLADAGEAEPHRGNLNMEQEKALKKKIAKGAWAIGKDKAQIHLSQEKVAAYEEAFAKIQTKTGITDMDELVEKFIEAEEKNFSMYNYVNQLSAEVEKLEASITDIRNEIAKYRGQGANSDNQRKRILRELEERLKKTEAKAETYDHKYEQSMRAINLLKATVQNLFNKIGCNTESERKKVMDMLGNQGVTEQNMMQYLGIIEQRANEVLQLFSARYGSVGSTALANQHEEKGGDFNALSDAMKQPSSGKSGPMKVLPPGIDDMSDDNGSGSDEDRPLTIQELQTRTLKIMTRKERRRAQKRHR